jgi:UDP-N-acetylmuramoylalanine--D-glutamate ligase
MKDTKRIEECIEHGRAVILGFGVSNRPLARLLSGMGARLCVRDAKKLSELGDDAASLIKKGVDFVCDADPTVGFLAEDMSNTLIFRSPGIRPDAGELCEAVRRGALLTSEMEWFCASTEAKIFAITGSDGKTTTTTLTHLLMSHAPSVKRAYVGGNIGTPLLSLAHEMTREDAAVLELSSFQLQTMHSNALRAAITNITPNHLNWHTDMQEYTLAKYNVFGDSTEILVLNGKNELSRAAAERFSGRVIFFSAYCTEVGAEYAELTGGRENSAAIFLRGDDVIYSDGESEILILHASEIKIPGIHNVENYMTAAALTWGYVPVEVISKVAREFSGVAHRLEFVRELDGVKYYNSSIDSSPSRSIAALSTFDCRPVVICGGRDKHVPFEPLADALIERASTVVLTGEAAPQIAEAIERRRAEADSEDALRVIFENDFEAAVSTARGAARKGSAVLLSPACTSFDRFSNFEERGNCFKKIVLAFQEKK